MTSQRTAVANRSTTGNRLVRIGLLAEVSAVLLTDYATPRATILWLLVAAVVYLLIARESRIAHGLQIAVAIMGIAVTAAAGTWSALAYTVEAVVLVLLWQRGVADTPKH